MNDTNDKKNFTLLPDLPPQDRNALEIRLPQLTLKHTKQRPLYRSKEEIAQIQEKDKSSQKTYKGLPGFIYESEFAYRLFLQWVIAEGEPAPVFALYEKLKGSKPSPNAIGRLKALFLWDERIKNLDQKLCDKISENARKYEDLINHPIPSHIGLLEDKQKTAYPAPTKMSVEDIKSEIEERMAEDEVRLADPENRESGFWVLEQNANPVEVRKLPPVEPLETQAVESRERRKYSRLRANKDAQDTLERTLSFLATNQLSDEKLANLSTQDATKILPSLVSSLVQLQKLEREEYGESANEDTRIDVNVVVKTLSVQLNFTPEEEEEFKMALYATTRKEIVDANREEVNEKKQEYRLKKKVAQKDRAAATRLMDEDGNVIEND